LEGDQSKTGEKIRAKTLFGNKTGDRGSLKGQAKKPGKFRGWRPREASK